MKNIFKHLSIIALAVAIGFSMVSCDTGSNPGTPTGENLPYGDDNGYKLVFTKDPNRTAYTTPGVGDSYKLSINGTPKSEGKVKGTDQDGKLILGVPNDDTNQFTVDITNITSEIKITSGKIPVNVGSGGNPIEISTPITLTPYTPPSTGGNGGNGGNGSNLKTFTINITNNYTSPVKHVKIEENVGGLPSSTVRYNEDTTIAANGGTKTIQVSIYLSENGNNAAFYFTFEDNKTAQYGHMGGFYVDSSFSTITVTIDEYGDVNPSPTKS